MSDCKYLFQGECVVASELAKLRCSPIPEQCLACSSHTSLPQRINGVTCSMARTAQIKAGLEPDPDLFECMQTEQLPISREKLEQSHKAWDALHSYYLPDWCSKTAERDYQIWVHTMIPEFGCNCKDDWEEITLYFPIVFERYMDYFVSCWYAHNLVNTKLFKPWFPLKDALKKYRDMHAQVQN